MRGRTRRASAPQVGDRVILLDCLEVRQQRSDCVGEAATITGVDNDLNYDIAVDGSGKPHLKLSTAAFLGSASLLYGDINETQPDDGDDDESEEEEEEEPVVKSAKKKSSRAVAKPNATPSTPEKAKRKSTLEKTKPTSSGSRSSRGPRDHRPERSRSGSRKTLRRTRNDPDEARRVERTNSFIEERRKEIVRQKKKSSRSRLVGMSSAKKLPLQLQKLLDRVNGSEMSSDSKCKPSFVYARPRDRIGNSIKLMKGKKQWRGYIKDYRESSGDFLVVPFSDPNDSDSDVESEAPRKGQWVNLNRISSVEYAQVVWAKMLGWPHWPAQIIHDRKPGDANKEANTNGKETSFVVEFFGTHDCATLPESKLVSYVENKEAFSNIKRLRKKLLEALDEADSVCDRRRKRRCLDSLNADSPSGNLHDMQSKLSPEQWISRRVSIWWPLDEEWYTGVIRRYDPETKMHFVVYSDTVEWLDLSTERVSLAISPDGPLPAEELETLLELEANDSDEKRDACFVCLDLSSAPSSELVVPCSACTAKCHTRCIASIMGEPSLNAGPIRCPSCLKCCMCDDVCDNGSVVSCRICEKRVHLGCLNPAMTESDVDEGYICNECRVCMCCSSTQDVFHHGFTICTTCFDSFNAGKYCRECFAVFKTNDKLQTCKKCLRQFHDACLTIGFCGLCQRKELSSKLLLVVNAVVAEDKHAHFRDPVSDEEAPQYSEIVKIPMSFTQILAKIERAEYASVQECRDDMNLIWKNAFAYNKTTSAVFKDAARLQKFCMSQFEEQSLHDEAMVQSSPSPSKRKRPNAKRALEASDNRNSKRVKTKQNLPVIEPSPIVSSWIDYASGLVYGRSLWSVDFCLVCLSSGSPEHFLCCADCGEAYHYFCLNSYPLRRGANRWRCPDCMLCETCGQADKVNELLQCDICDAGTHLQCNQPRLSKVPDNGFHCNRCVRCRCCGSTTPGKNGQAKWMYDYTMCTPCGQLYAQKKFCPVCDCVWKPSDKAPMVCCDKCDMWVHIACDNIDDARYQDMADNPDSKYYCPICRADSPKAPSPPPPIEEEPTPMAVDMANLRDRDLAVRAGDTPLADVYKSMSNMVLMIQQKRRRSRRRMLLDTAHLGRGNKHVKVLARKASFKLSPVEARSDDVANPKGSEAAVAVSNPILQEPLSNSQRRCRLCHVVGDAAESTCGRLIRVSPYIWVHARCLIWSAEIRETEMGVLVNVEKALIRAKVTRCAWCSELGATINCCSKECLRSFHFTCAKRTSCVFLNDCRTYCHLHTYMANKAASLDVLATERIRRKLVVKSSNQPSGSSNETSWPGDGSIVLRIGALSVESLGEIHHETDFFHSRSHIYPIGFRSHRIFWSIKIPGSRTLYTCTIGTKTVSGILRPLFSISAADDPDVAYSGHTPAQAWSLLVNKVEGFSKHNNKRTLAASGDTFAFGLSGAVFFGLGHPEVIPYINNLPGALKCKNYTSSGPEADRSMVMEINESGSARTEGYSSKRSRNKAKTSSIRSSDAASATVPLQRTRTGSGPRDAVPPATLYRRLKTEQQRPVAQRSPIHGFGLFATQRYNASDMVIEFVGEIVRSIVADQREKVYERRGVGSCFMFRLDDDYVIDATARGCSARYINHSCNGFVCLSKIHLKANCTAQVMSFDGGKSKHIIIIALRDVEVGEEITYDYKFPQEEERIACTCGAENCTGRLN